MAIGTSITPRSYNVDTTGRAYTLDPDPLLDVQQRAYASQQENLRQTGAVALKGIEFAEMVGARQQLGRVKAKISELDVNDPMFAQKYSSIVMENPLAFTNERVAPVTKAAITPVLASAAQAMQNRASLERAKVMAGYQADLADTRYDNQRNLYDHRRANPIPRAATPHRVTAGESLLFGGGVGAGEQTNEAAPVAPGASTGDGSIPGGVDVPPLPVDGAANGGAEADLLEPYPTLPQGPVFQPEDGGGVVEGQGDGAGLTYGNGVLTSQTGTWDLQSVTGDGVTARPRVVAQPPNPAVLPPDMRGVPKDFNPDGSPASWGAEKKPDTAKERDAALEAIVNTDEDVVTASTEAAAAEAAYQGKKAQALALPKDAREAFAPQVAIEAVTAANAAAKARVVRDAVMLREMAVDNPRAAQELADRQRAKDMAAIPKYGTGEDWAGGALLRPPTPKATPVEPEKIQPVKEQISRRDEAPLRKTWDSEKVFALNESFKIDAALDYSRGTTAKAIADGSSSDVSAILNDARKRGVKSPLLRTGYSQEGMQSTVGWTRSKALPHGYNRILEVAYKDPDARKAAEATAATEWAGEGFKIRAK